MKCKERKCQYILMLHLEEKEEKTKDFRLKKLYAILQHL